jgi:NADH dehydrogenase FAD-containing subunit
LGKLRDKGVSFIQAEIKQLYPKKRYVETDLGVLYYDYLIISLGAEHHPETIPVKLKGPITHTANL